MPFHAVDVPAAGRATVTMQVAPDRIDALRDTYTAVHARVSSFLLANQVDVLAGMGMFGNDSVSKAATHAFTENARLAVRVSRQFIDELEQSIEQLDAAAATYREVEGDNVRRFGEGRR